LREEFLIPFGITQYRLAKKIGLIEQASPVLENNGVKAA